MVAAGMHHMVGVGEDGCLYSWGKRGGWLGRGGVGEGAGGGEGEGKGEGVGVSQGAGECASEGGEGAEEVVIPGRCAEDGPVTAVACGEQHTVAVLGGGRCIGFGNNSYGALGVGSFEPWVAEPAFLVGVERGGGGGDTRTTTTHVVCGSNHTVVVTAGA
jgi:alpha-tubulin suppressor-like RCC1 family protein